MTETLIKEPIIQVAKRDLLELAERKGTSEQSQRMGALIALISRAHSEFIDIKTGIRNRETHAHHSLQSLHLMRKLLFEDIRRLIPEIEAETK